MKKVLSALFGCCLSFVLVSLPIHAKLGKPIGSSCVKLVCDPVTGKIFPSMEDCKTSPKRPICGNGILEGIEECDDGNTTVGDGCSSRCTVEKEAECSDAIDNDADGAIDCEDFDCANDNSCLPNPTNESDCINGIDDDNDGYVDCTDVDCVNTPACTFQPPACGNGFLEIGEECDDGNNTNGDGCSSTCKLE